MIEEVSIINAYTDYSEAMSKAKAFKEDAILVTLHGPNGQKMHAPISKSNWESVLGLFGTDDEVCSNCKMPYCECDEYE